MLFECDKYKAVDTVLASSINI